MVSGYHMARDEFIRQTNDGKNTILAEKSDNISELIKKSVIFIARENTDLFVDLVAKLSDIDERLILIKNIDFFPEEVFDIAKSKSKLMISGDVDKCSFKEKIMQKSFKTKVVFSKPMFDVGFQIPELSKYQGYLWEENKQGIVTLETDNG